MSDFDTDPMEVYDMLLNDQTIHGAIGFQFCKLELVCPLKLKIQEKAEEVAALFNNKEGISLEIKLKVNLHLAGLTQNVAFILDFLSLLLKSIPLNDNMSPKELASRITERFSGNFVRELAYLSKIFPLDFLKEIGFESVKESFMLT